MKWENKQRKFFRMPFVAKISGKIEGSENVFSGSVRDISSLGLFIETSYKLDLGTRCECEIILSGNNSRLIIDQLKAKVIRQDDDGLALNLEEHLEWVALVPIYFHKMR